MSESLQVVHLLSARENLDALDAVAGATGGIAEVRFRGPDPDQVRLGVAAYEQTTLATYEGWQPGHTVEDFTEKARRCLENGGAVVRLAAPDVARTVHEWSSLLG